MRLDAKYKTQEAPEQLTQDQMTNHFYLQKNIETRAIFRQNSQCVRKAFKTATK